MKRKMKKCRLFILSALFMVCACCGFLFPPQATNAKQSIRSKYKLMFFIYYIPLIEIVAIPKP